jgi:hypothetical protein
MLGKVYRSHIEWLMEDTNLIIHISLGMCAFVQLWCIGQEYNNNNKAFIPKQVGVGYDA